MSQEIVTAGAAARDALNAVIGGAPAEAHTILTDATFETRALIAAWTEEVHRLVGEAEVQYAAQVKEDFEFFGRTLTRAERDEMNRGVHKYLAGRYEAKLPRTTVRDLRDGMSGAMPTGVFPTRQWAKSELRRQELKGVVSLDENAYDEYHILRNPTV